MKAKPTRVNCSGCRDDFYNHNNMGLNMESGRPQCSSLEGAEFVKRLRIPMSLPPPYSHIKPESVPKCYRAAGYVFVDPDKINSRGFWK